MARYRMPNAQTIVRRRGQNARYAGQARRGQRPGQTPPIHTMPPNGWQQLPGQGPNPYDTGWNQGMGNNGGGGEGGFNIDNLPAAYLAKLKEAGLTVGPNGRINGMGMGTDLQRKLAQRGYNKFGLTNTFFDPTRAGFRNGSMYSLGTGSRLSGTGPSVLRDQALGNLQDRAGYDVATALANGGYGPNSGIAFQSPEMYQRYLDAARANYQLNAGQQVTNPNAQSLLDAGTIRMDVPGAVPSYTNQPLSETGRPPASQQPTPTTDQNRGPQTPNRPNSPPIVNQGGGGNSSQGTGQNGANNASPATTVIQAYEKARKMGLPLDPQFEMQMRQIEDQLQAALTPLGAARENLSAYGKLQTGRLATNQDIDVQALKENLAGRGVMNSSLYGDNLQDISTNYLRQNQDLGNSLISGMGDIGIQESNAYLNYNQQIMEALVDLANRAAQMNTIVSARAPNRGRRANRGRRVNRGGRGGRNG